MIKVKALWGFVGSKGRVYAGEEIDVPKQYGHALIGKGLAAAVGAMPAPKGGGRTNSADAGKPKPTENKKTKPKEGKAAKAEGES